MGTVPQWATAAAAVAVPALMVLGMWVRLQVRLARLEAHVTALEGVLHRVEDAIWASVGLRALAPQRGEERP